MSDPFLGEIKLVSFNFAPKGWALCNGQLLPINQNQALFALMGTTYGGNGQTTFALPDLQGRVPVHTGNGHVIGEKGGEESHTLSIAELPTHTHAMAASSANGNSLLPSANVLAAVNDAYGPSADDTALYPGSISNTGGSQAHTNLQPYLAINFVVALQGIFPSQN